MGRPERVEGVVGLLAVLEAVQQPDSRRLAQLRQREPGLVGQVGEHRAFAARVHHHADPGTGTPTQGRQEVEGVGHLVEIGDLADAVAAEHRGVGLGPPGQRTGVRLGELAALLGRSHLESDDGDAPLGRRRQCGQEPLRLTNGLEIEPDHRRMGVGDHVVQVVGLRDHRLVASRYGDAECQAR